jgi:hypothetical protein
MPPCTLINSIFCGLCRLFTSGYDFYAPPDAVIYHLWSRAHRPTQNADALGLYAHTPSPHTPSPTAPATPTASTTIPSKQKVDLLKEQSLQYVFDLLTGGEKANNTNLKQEQALSRRNSYGLGHVRTIEEFAKNVGADFHSRTVLKPATAQISANTFLINNGIYMVKFVSTLVEELSNLASSSSSSGVPQPGLPQRPLQTLSSSSSSSSSMTPFSTRAVASGLAPENLTSHKIPQEEAMKLSSLIIPTLAEQSSSSLGPGLSAEVGAGGVHSGISSAISDITMSTAIASPAASPAISEVSRGYSDNDSISKEMNMTRKLEALELVRQFLK